MKPLISLLGLLASQAFAQAQFSANDLMTELSNRQDPNYLHALGYISGARHALEVNDLAQQKPTLCIPPPVTTGQIVDAVQRELQEDFKNRHVSASLYVYGALYKNWRCAK